MNDLRNAAEMALEALMQTTLEDVMVEVEPNVWEYKSIVAIQALRQALDLQTAIERGTKAWADVPNATEWAEELRGYDTPEVTPDVDNAKLDTIAGVLHKEWVGLTDEEIQAERHKLDLTAGWTYDHFARVIEAKLKEKNVPQP
jgi:hypothetical protein